MRPLIKRADRFTETAIDDEIVIMRLDNGAFFTLSDTAAAAWRLIDGQRDGQAIVCALACQYAVDEARIAEDVHDLIVKLSRTGVLEQA